MTDNTNKSGTYAPVTYAQTYDMLQGNMPEERLQRLSRLVLRIDPAVWQTSAELNPGHLGIVMLAAILQETLPDRSEASLFAMLQDLASSTVYATAVSAVGDREAAEPVTGMCVTLMDHRYLRVAGWPGLQQVFDLEVAAWVSCTTHCPSPWFFITVDVVGMLLSTIASMTATAQGVPDDVSDPA